MKRPPTGLGVGGRALWRAVTAVHNLDVVQEITLLEACRAKDRLDRLDGLIRGESVTWATLTPEAVTYELKIDGAPTQANTTATMLKQLMAALRLPDPSTGKRPQHRGGARGTYWLPPKLVR